MPSIKKLLQAAAGNAGESLYVEDVFSTYLYTGSNAARTIDNNIALSDEGGLVWLKQRGALDSHVLFDTVNGPEASLSSNSTDASSNYSSYLSFPSAGTTGWNLSGAILNGTGTTWASWTFRKAEKFFDVVTYTGNGVAGRTVAHNLGSVPACMIVKRTNAAQGWAVYHVEMDATNPENWMMRLNSTAVRVDLTPSRWNDTAPTSTEFTLSDNDEVNGSGDTYVAYLFASDAGGFGDDGDENIIKCGTFTTDGTQTAEVTGLGWEPQYVLYKNVDLGNNWNIHDSMRGMPWGSYTVLAANTNGAEVSGAAPVISPTPDGFLVNNANYNAKSIYIAIRRPMKTPEAGTEVFSPVTSTGTGSARTLSGTFPTDLTFMHQREATDDGRTFAWDRLRGKSSMLQLTNTSAEAGITGVGFDVQNGLDLTDSGFSNYNTAPYITYLFKRATGFFDVVAYTGDGTNKVISHNLGVKPELIITKPRSNPTASATDWIVYAEPLTNSNFLYLNQNLAAVGAALYPSEPTTDNYTVLGVARIGDSGGTNISYLFATLAGVSKVGSYTGTGANLNVDCGFSAGARFILIKRTDSTGDWYVWDSARGIVAGNDPYLLLNSTAVEVTNTDYIDPLNAGFTVTSSAPAALNASGGSYIFLAIA